jgi:tetratricopeptide (TPR) repeat protein
MAADPEQSTSPQEMRWLLPLLLTPLLLWGCWNAPFLELDDIRLIKNNPHLKSEAPWSAVFDPRMDSIYIPLTFLAFRIERNVGEAILSGSLGERAWPAAIRFGSLALNILAALAIWKLLRALKASPKCAGFVAAACALHPTVCHSVCWPMEEKTMLSAMFGFAALALYVSVKSRFHYFVAAGLYVLALLAKPAALGLLPVVLCWEFLGRPKLDGSFENTPLRNPRELLPAALRALPWIVASLAAIFIQTKMVENDATLPPIGGSLFTVAMTDVPVLLRYIINFIWPFGLSADYGLPAILSPADPKFLLSLICLLAIFGAIFFLAGKTQRRSVLFGWLWFVGALGPVLNFVGKNNLMADCYAYYSAPAFWLIVALSVEGIATKIPTQSRSMLAAVGVAAFSVFLASLSAHRSSAFASTEALFEDSVRKEPQASLNHLLLAQILRARTDRYLAAGESEKHKEALHRELEELKAGVAGVNFDRTRLVTDSYIWLGRSYYENGKPDEATEALEKARHSPQGIDRTRAAAILRLMGLMAFDRGEFEQSVKFYDSALGLEPAQSQIWLDRTRALLVLRNKSKIAGDSAAAEKYLQEARKALNSVPAADPVRAKLLPLFDSNIP